MAANIFTYDHPINMSTESGELLGTAHFVGTARIHRRTGRPGWSGRLHTNIDPLVLVASGTLCLEFDNGSVGHVRCTNSSINAWSERGAMFLVGLRGEGDPPRVEASQLVSEVPIPRPPTQGTPTNTCPRCKQDEQVMYNPGGPIALCNPCWAELGAQWDIVNTEKD